MVTRFLSLKVHAPFSVLETQNGCHCIAVKEDRLELFYEFDPSLLSSTEKLKKMQVFLKLWVFSLGKDLRVAALGEL